MKKLIALIILAIILVGAWYTWKILWSAVPGTPANTVAFQCDGDRSITATFYPGTDMKVDLKLSDGRKLSIPRAISASGARYANEDESFVFWNKGNTAFIEENGAKAYENCVLKEAGGPLNATYGIENRDVALVNGKSELEIAPGSATRIETSAFGEPVYGDLNRDGNDDAAMFIVQNPGGTGTFYYAAAALNNNGTYKGMNAVLLGDRIAPQTIEIRGGMLIANYAERKPGEPFSIQPSIGVSKYLMIQGGKLVESPQVME